MLFIYIFLKKQIHLINIFYSSIVHYVHTESDEATR